jgi:chemotaxis protein CheD
MNNTLVVGISDMKLSTNPGDVIVTYSLGSCLGVTVYDPKARIGGMVHCLLPSAAAAREKARANPFMFVNTGVAMTVRRLVDLGADKSRLVFKAAGGANMRKDRIFDTGVRNFKALMKLLDRNNKRLAAKDVGGTIPRTLFLYLDSGRVVVRSLGKESDL